MGPCDLEEVLLKIPVTRHPKLLSSVRAGEDAGIYVLSDDTVLVQSLDFFPPVVDDPETYGKIAAANALSDVYAKGARPITAMNLIAFPPALPAEVLVSIMLGGLEKLKEADVLLVGGHTIEDPVPKYGLSVTGIAKRSELMLIQGAAPGDVLLMTKPIGTGILTTALKAGLAEEEEMEEAVSSMCALNGPAAAVLREHGATACTDITGFGLAGHLFELLKASRVSADVWCEKIPVFPRARELAEMGALPGGLFRNRKYVGDALVPEAGLDPFYADIVFDPQTSGGLLASLPAANAGSALRRMAEMGIGCALIGSVGEPPPIIRLRMRGSD